MLVSTDPPFVFVALPRTGSHSIRQMLRSFPNIRSVGGHHQMAVPTWATGPRFAVIRNPYAVHLSHYLYRKRKRRNNMYQRVKKQSFVEYLTWMVNPRHKPYRPHDPPQAVALRLAGVDHMVRFERLESELRSLPFLPSDLELPHLNANLAYSCDGYYDPEAMALVRDFAMADFELGGYSTGSLPDE